MARYTPEFIALLRRRYEETDQSLSSLALEFDISERTICRMVVRENWKRRADRPPRTLSPAQQLLEEARALERRLRRAERKNDATDKEELAAIARIERQGHARLAALEDERNAPDALTPAAGERRSRSLAMLAEALMTMHALRRDRFGVHTRRPAG